MKRSLKTTITGVIAGIIAILHAISGAVGAEGDFMDNMLQGGTMGEIMAGVSVMLLGIFSRDDDVSSEGGMAPKNQ